MRTAAITRDEARRVMDRLHETVHAYQSAAYQRGAAVAAHAGEDDTEARAAIGADLVARRDCLSELAAVRELVVGLIAERDRAAGVVS